MHWRSTNGTSRSRPLCRNRWESPKSRYGMRSTRSYARGRSSMWVRLNGSITLPPAFPTCRDRTCSARPATTSIRRLTSLAGLGRPTTPVTAVQSPMTTWLRTSCLAPGPTCCPRSSKPGGSDPNGHPVQNQVNLQARRDLWRNCLHGGFPNVQHDPRGYGTGNKVRDLRKLRNRVSHMDSLLYVDVQHQHDRVLLPLLNSISHELRDWVQGRNKVRVVLTQRPIAGTP